MNSIRCEFESKLLGMPLEYSKKALAAFDTILVNYNFTSKCTSLSTEVSFVYREAELYKDCREVEGQSKDGIRNRMLTINAFLLFVNKPMKDITPMDVRNFLYSYKQQRDIKDITLDRYRSHLSGFFSWCLAEGLIDKNPMANIKPIKYEKTRRVSLTQLELEELRKVCNSPREKCILEMLYSTGCRVSELAQMQKSDIDFIDNSAIVHGKGKKMRKVFLNAKAIVSLRTYLEIRKDDCPYVLVRTRKDHDGKYQPLSARAIRDEVLSIVARTPVQKRVTPHILRHTTATTGLQNGMPIESIQNLLGHSSCATTLVYADIDVNKVHNEHTRCVI